MSKYTPQDIIESDSITIVRTKLKGDLFELQLKENDKGADIDGQIRLRDGRGKNLDKFFHVQIKGTKQLKPEKYRCSKQISVFTAKTTIPFVLLIADVRGKKLYWHIPKRAKKNKSYTVDLSGNEIADGGNDFHDTLNSLTNPTHNKFNAAFSNARIKSSGLASNPHSKGKVRQLAKFLDQNLTRIKKEAALKKINELGQIKTTFSQYCYEVYLGNLHSYYGENSRAIAAYKKAISSYSDPLIALTNLSLMYCLKGESEKAIALLERHKKQGKRSAHYWNTLGLSYMSLTSQNGSDSLVSAKQFYEKAFKMKPSDPNIAFNLLACLRNFPDRSEYEVFKKVCKDKFLSDPLIANEISTDEYQKYCETADKRHLERMGELLIPLLNKYIEFDAHNKPRFKVPQSEYNRQTYQSVLENAASYLYHAGQQEKAGEIWKLLIDDDDSCKSVHQNLALFYAAGGNTSTALIHIDKAKGHPRFSYQLLGGMLMECFFQNRQQAGFWNISLIREARRAFRDAFNESNDIDMLINEAACMCVLNQRDAALKQVSDVKEKHPNHYFANLKSIQIRLAKRRTQSLFQELEELSKTFPNEYDHVFQLAHLYESENSNLAGQRYDEAINRLLKHPKRMEAMNAQQNILQAAAFFENQNNALKALRILNKCISGLQFVDQLVAEKNRLLALV